ncbi:MAG TPA: hypothetical protein DCW68_03875 [Rhodospirillaceae bacterium]|nr:MAG: hypothetical protein A2018_07060 [Alphaproteobacteria bacterium GWF2_58_20]HAU29233.1 hypothetical protein [Rhodospirillaceae bacterium]
MLRKILFSLFAMSVVVQAGNAAEMKHVFRRRIEICLAWGGCDESGAMAGMPVISDIADITVRVGDVVPQAGFTLKDPDTPVNALVVSVSSGNTGLFPNDGLAVVLGGEGGNRTLDFVPVAGRTGISTISVVVGDGSHTAIQRFRVTVLPENTDDPWIYGISDLTVTVGDPLPMLSFFVDDNETLPENLNVSVMDVSSPEVVALVAPGSQPDGRELYMTVADGWVGSAGILLEVVDEDGHVGQAVQVISIIYPSGNAPGLSAVADIVREVGEGIDPVVVTVFDNGEGQTPVEDLVLTAQSSNSGLIPVPLVGGSGETRSVTLVPVSGGTGTSVITLTVTDDEGQEATESFAVTINPRPGSAPFINPVADVVVPYGMPLDSLFATVGDTGPDLTPDADLVLESFTSDAALIPAPQVVSGGVDNQRRLDFATPVPDLYGSAIITLVVHDKDGETASRNFRVTIEAPPSTAPFIDPVANITKYLGETIDPVAITVGDDATDAGNLVVVAMAENHDLLPMLGGVEVSGGGVSSQRMITLAPATGFLGTSDIVLLVTDGDGETGFTRFTLTIQPWPSNPVISGLHDVEAIEGDPLEDLVFSVVDRGDDPTPAGDITITLQSVDADLLPVPSMASDGNEERTLSFFPAAGETGFSVVTVTASDKDGETASGNFRVTIHEKPWPGPVILNTFTDIEKLVGEAIDPIMVEVEDQGVPPTPPELIDVWAGTSADGINILVVDGAEGQVGETDIPLPREDEENPGQRTLRLVPSPGQIGRSTVTVGAMDEDGNIREESFNVNIVEGGNAAPIIGSTSYPFPENIFVNRGAVPSVTIWYNDCDTVYPYCDEPGDTRFNLLDFKITSSNQELVPDVNIVQTSTYNWNSNSWGYRKFSIQALDGAYGTTTITVEVTDAGFRTTKKSFDVTFNALPVIVGLDRIYAYRNLELPRPIQPFSVYDPDSPSSEITVYLDPYYNYCNAWSQCFYCGGGASNDDHISIVSKGNYLYDVSVGLPGCGETWVKLRVSDGHGYTELSVPVTAWTRDPRTIPWVYVPASTLPNGVHVPAFTVDRDKNPNIYSGRPSTATFLSAVASCANLGFGYHLMTDYQWMAIANMLAEQPDNWTGTGSDTSSLLENGVGVGTPIRGHTDNYYSSIYHITSDLSQSYSNVGYRGTYNNFNQVPGTIAGKGAEQRRTFIMPSGQYLWDFSGNVIDWVWCDDENPKCENGMVKPGVSYTGLSASDTPRALNTSGITATWLLPKSSWRGIPEFGAIVQNHDETTSIPLLRGGGYNSLDMGGMYGLKHTVATTSGSTAGYRCVGPADALNIVAVPERPTISNVSSQEVTLGAQLSVQFDATDAETAANYLTVRGFKDPYNNQLVTVAGTANPRTLTSWTDSTALPVSRTYTIEARDSTGAMVSHSFNVTEIEGDPAQQFVEIDIQTENMDFTQSLTCSDPLVPMAVPVRKEFLVKNSGSVPIFGGLEVELVNPMYFLWEIPSLTDDEWCPIAGFSSRGFYPGEFCKIRVGARSSTQTGTFLGQLAISANSGNTKVVNLKLKVTSNCPAPVTVGNPVYCEEGGCIVDCPQGGCEVYCQGGGCTTNCTGGKCINTCVGGSCTNNCIGGGCKNDCLGGNCENVCTGGNCVNSCTGGGCKNTCTGSSCTNQCAGGNCDDYCTGLNCWNICEGGGCTLHHGCEPGNTCLPCYGSDCVPCTYCSSPPPPPPEDYVPPEDDIIFTSPVEPKPAPPPPAPPPVCGGACDMGSASSGYCCLSCGECWGGAGILMYWCVTINKGCCAYGPHPFCGLLEEW